MREAVTMSDALFGPDGTQAPPPPPLYQDALSGPARSGERALVSVPRKPTSLSAPVKPARPTSRMREAVADSRRRPAAAAPTGAVPVAYSSPRRVGPASRVAATRGRKRTGASVTGWIIALLVFGSLAFNALRNLGILR